ncbi:MAG: ice-binding family protein, partial [Actinomycetota bacterium]|nr:ice-binding family protein [Actinomycetota bacterium]
MATLVSIALAVFGGPAGAQPVGLGTAESFAVLAGTTVTNTGPTTISGNVGVSPGTAVTGFPPGIVTNGTIHAANAVAAQAQADLTTAYLDAAGRTPCTPLPSALGGGQVLGPGVYCAGTFVITGELILRGDADDVFIFQAGSTLITAAGSTIRLEGGAQACNVFWQVGSSATLGVGSTFVGTILALTSITAETNAVIQGRLLARNGAVTLDSNTITVPVCAVAPTTTSSTTPGPTTTAAGPTTTAVAPTTTAVAPTTTAVAP